MPDNSTASASPGLASPAANRWRSWVIVLGVLLLFFWGAFYWQGINLYDDTCYMSFGLKRDFGRFLHMFSDSPLYAEWFWLLTFVFHDAIWRYMASWAITVAAVTTIPLCMLNRRAWLYAVLLTCLPVFCVVPSISLFAAIFITAGMAYVLAKAPSYSTALCIGCAASFIAAYVRPEFAYGTFLAAAAALVAFPFDTRRGPARNVLLKLLIILSLPCALRYSMTHSHGSRSGIAFVEHANLRAQEKGLLHGEPYPSSTYTLRQYGIAPPESLDAQPSIGDFFRANPHLFLAHVLENLRDRRSLAAVLSLLAVTFPPWLLPRFRRLRAASMYLLLVFLPPLAGLLLIYPRAHYAVTSFPAMLLLAVYLLPPGFSLQPPSPLAVLLTTAMVLAVEARIYRHGHIPDIQMNIRAHLIAIECMREVQSEFGSGNGTMIDPVWVFYDNQYLPRFMTTLQQPGGPDWKTFLSWVQQTHPAWIVNSPLLAGMYGHTPADVDGLLRHQLGYTPRPCSQDTYITIYTPAK